MSLLSALALTRSNLPPTFPFVAFCFIFFFFEAVSFFTVLVRFLTAFDDDSSSLRFSDADSLSKFKLLFASFDDAMEFFLIDNDASAALFVLFVGFGGSIVGVNWSSFSAFVLPIAPIDGTSRDFSFTD